MTRALQHISDWFGRVMERANPILVKETRQSLKGRQFVATFMLLLVASWIISAAYAINSPEAIEYGAVAMDLFFAFYVVLAFAVLVVVPLGAFLSLSSENQENTFDLLSITTLKPGQIVRGKLASTSVQMFVYYSAIAPFMAFTALLDGFDFACCVFLLGITMLACVSASTLALMMASVLRHRRLQSLAGMFWLLAVLGGLLFLFGSFLSMAGGLTQMPLILYRHEFWIFTGCMCLAAVSYVILVQQVTASQLTFESDNHSSGIRFTASIQVGLYVLTLYLLGTFMPTTVSTSSGELFSYCVLVELHLLAIGFFQVTAPDTLSRRVQRDLPANPLYRLLWIPFLPGGHRGFLWVIVNLIAIALLLVVIPITSVSSDWPALRNALWASVAYLVIFLGSGATLSRWLLRTFPQSRMAHVRVILIIFVAACMILPYVPLILGLQYSSSDYNALEILNPFATIYAIASQRDEPMEILLWLLAALAGVTLYLNARVLWVESRQILNNQSPATRLAVMEPLVAEIGLGGEPPASASEDTA